HYHALHPTLHPFPTRRSSDLEVHYVPAARQMLEPAMLQPMLNPMHPPLGKQLIALSIRTFGDSALGWRYPGALFGALAVVAIYLDRKSTRLNSSHLVISYAVF